MIELDLRIADGMRDQLRVRERLLAEGARPLGWKVGFGGPAARAQLGIDRPLVGFLTDRGLLSDGATVDLGGWTNPVLELEIAVHMGEDAVAGFSVAMELADLDPPPTDVRAILAGNIFHRHVFLGGLRPEITSADGIRGRLLRDGEEIGATDEPTALPGEPLEVVRLTAELLEACGERLRAGEVVITGAVIAPLPVAAGESWAVDLGPLGGLSVSFRP